MQGSELPPGPGQGLSSCDSSSVSGLLSCTDTCPRLLPLQHSVLLVAGDPSFPCEHRAAFLTASAPFWQVSRLGNPISFPAGHNSAKHTLFSASG